MIVENYFVVLMKDLLDFVLNNLALIVAVLGIFVVVIRILLHKFFKTEYGLTDAKGDIKIGVDYLQIKGKKQIYFAEINKIDLLRYFEFGKGDQPHWQPKIVIKYTSENSPNKNELIIDPPSILSIPYIVLYPLRYGGDLGKKDLSNLISNNNQRTNPVLFRFLNGEEIQFNEISPMKQEGIDGDAVGGSFRLLEK